MEKYSDNGTSTKYISSDDIQFFRGLENETFINFDTSQGMNFPLRVTMCGITYPTPEYYIKRFPVRGYILEYVVSGKGYVVVNGKKHIVTAHDAYLLKIGENCEYYADKNDPYKKLWVNFYGPFAQDIVTEYGLKETVYKCDLSALFEKLFDTEKVSTVLSEVHFKLANIISEMILKLAESISYPKNASEIAKSIYKAVATSVNIPFKLEELSKTLFVSKSELIRHFKRAYGVSPYRYLINLRIVTLPSGPSELIQMSILMVPEP